MAKAREWTAEIESDGVKLYAWFAFNQRWGTFATLNLEHARMFETEADVLAWIQRLNVENAEPVKVRAGKPVRTAAGRRA